MQAFQLTFPASLRMFLLAGNVPNPHETRYAPMDEHGEARDAL